MMTTRREFCSKTGALLLGPALYSPFSFSKSASNFALQSAHTQAAMRAGELAKNRKVELAILYPKGALGNIQPAGDLFTEISGISVKYIEASLDDINTRITLSAIAQNTEFDLALPATFGLPDLVEASAIENLDRFAQEYEPHDFQKDALYTLGDYYKGSLYGYQTDGDTYLMFYHKAWLESEQERSAFKERYGKALKVPDTWEELDQLIEFFHRPKEDKYGGSLFRTPNYIAWEWWMRFHALGFYPLDDQLTPQINNEAGIKALKDIIHVSQFLEPKVNINGLFDNFKSFSEGNKFCNIGWGGSQKYFNGPSSNVRGNLIYSPAPGGVVNGKLIQTPFFNWGWNYVVSSNSKEKEIAYLFSLFACSPHVSTIAVRKASGYFDPFRTSHYQDSEIIKTYTEEFLIAHQKSMVHSIPDFYLKGQGEYFDALKGNLTAAYQGKLSPKDALDLTAMQWKRITYKIGRKSQQEQWQFLKSKYPADLREILS